MIVEYDYCADGRNAYNSLESLGYIKYLGKGYYYSIDNILLNSTHLQHFWAYQ